MKKYDIEGRLAFLFISTIIVLLLATLVSFVADFSSIKFAIGYFFGSLAWNIVDIIIIKFFKK
jgi:hypothetical protein